MVEGWLFFDIELAQANAQGAVIKTKDFSRTITADKSNVNQFDSVHHLELSLLIFNFDGVVKTSIYCVVKLFPAFGILPVCRARKNDHSLFICVFT